MITVTVSVTATTKGLLVVLLIGGTGIALGIAAHHMLSKNSDEVIAAAKKMWGKQPPQPTNQPTNKEVNN
jgi:hypothetical protein